MQRNKYDLDNMHLSSFSTSSLSSNFSSSPSESNPTNNLVNNRHAHSNDLQNAKKSKNNYSKLNDNNNSAYVDENLIDKQSQHTPWVSPSDRELIMRAK